jgi:hypothetical protein
MIPDIPTVLNGITRSLMFDLAPEVQTPYGSLTVQLCSGLLMMVAQEFDRAAARLVEENEALAAIFHAAAEVVREEGLRADLSGAGSTADSLQVSALRAHNRALRALLVRLQEHVEELDGAAARALEDRIWAELAASTARRQLDLANG